MESLIAKELGMIHQPVALLWSDEKPEGALQFKEGKWGCVMWLVAHASKGKTAVFDINTYGCWGGGVGLGFGNQYEKFPGGLECFSYFLSIGNKHWEKGRMVGEELKKVVKGDFAEEFLEGEGYIKSPEIVSSFVENLPIMTIPKRYVVFKPLKDVSSESPEVVIFWADPNQLSALVVLANMETPTEDRVIVPFAAGCQALGIIAYRESTKEKPRAIIGQIDISARKNVKSMMGDNLFTFITPWKLFVEMERNVKDSFLTRPTWRELIK